jgi:hypothetical protein
VSPPGLSTCASSFPTNPPVFREFVFGGVPWRIARGRSRYAVLPVSPGNRVSDASGCERRERNASKKQFLGKRDSALTLNLDQPRRCL